jgi:hypothetical protein
MNDRWARLHSLKNELLSVPTFPWNHTEAWIAKAKPIVRNDWPEHIDDFQSVTKAPRWCGLPMAFGRDEDENRLMVQRTKKIEETTNRQIAVDSRAQILSFLEGLITVACSRSDVFILKVTWPRST